MTVASTTVHTADPVTLRVRADRLFDGERLRTEPLIVEIAGERISAIRPAEATEALGAGPWLDARGRTLIPGLINAHAHIARGGMFGPLEPLSIPQIVRNLRGTLAAGVTTIGEMGCSAPLARALREHVGTHPAAGPSILAAGPVLTAPGGYPLDWLPPLYTKLGVVLACPDERAAGRAVERVARAGMQQVKIAVMHQSYAERPLPAISLPAAQAVVREAHRLGRRVYAHAHSVRDYRKALDAGVDALVHSSFEPLDRELVTRIAASGIPVSPTLWVFESVCLGAEGCWYRDPRYAGAVSGAIRREWRRFSEAYAASGAVLPDGIAGGLRKSRVAEAIRVAGANLVLLADAGVPIAFGNDAAYGFCVHTRPVDELLAMERAGLSRLACLRAATAGAADLLGASDRGRIAVGRRADFVLVDGDPAADLRHLERVAAVVARGQLVTAGGAARGRAVLALRSGAAILNGLARTVTQALRSPL